MPRRPAPLFHAVEPITTEDVIDLWRSATSKAKRRPSAEACAEIAWKLNAHLYHGAADHQLARDFARAGDAAHLLMGIADKYLQPLEAVPPVRKSADRVYPVPQPELPLLSVIEYQKLTELRLLMTELLPIFRPFADDAPSPAQALWFGSVPGGSARLAALVQQSAERRHRAQVARKAGAPLPGVAWEATAVVCWLIAGDALVELGQSVGVVANTVAVKFAAAATARLGFEGVTPNALAKHLRRMDDAQATDEPSR